MLLSLPTSSVTRAQTYMEATTVRPLRVRFLMADMTLRAWKLSSPDDGSSMKRMAGSAISSCGVGAGSKVRS